MKRYIFITMLVVGIQSCIPDNNQRAGFGFNGLESSDEQIANGYELFKANCYSCHNPAAASHDAMLAPPMAGIKMHYSQTYPDKNDFIRKMSAFVHSPSEEAALMKGPIRRFGLMPKPNVTPEQIKAIVTFIYENKVEEPTWFAEHEAEMHNKKPKN